MTPSSLHGEGKLHASADPAVDSQLMRVCVWGQCAVAVEAERAIIRTKALHGGLPSDVMHSIKASLSIVDSTAVTA